ncbi:dTMP kinase [Metamycoplasma hyosynoviae]|uniref:Thymidylate kinase n=1 Tax=Metamycoplasma hyosynoviae TaxID=29559 RepID=A0AAP4EM36_9BACT|nr:dTMP kinase [Metamycoplasma hyosynoviae]MDC8920326.1 dTMP kinase [Metamycoplasma hyosynoviae]MDC8937063.1 dTMP kinase [Metamycoplasma hyosynoviae]MDD1366187.1 dTMP kinase [Metamycoplasma hyosynoviae]MDD1377713.1 dTMP kinase [Metamycoplasma hyosynoviae]MDD7837695.1 dTMP kinase [Metamycoplasma hyosynoviae]
MSNKRIPKFIVFEGMDCAGKSSILKLIEEKLKKFAKADNYVFTREPGSKNSKEAEQIRQIILNKENNLSTTVDALLFMASRRINLETTVWPALKENKTVFSDRYWHSSFVYQGILGDLGYKVVRKLNEIITSNTKPDLIIFFDLMPEKVVERLKRLRKEADRMERMNEEYYQTLYSAYRSVINYDKHKFVIIDSNCTLEELFEKTWKILVERKIVDDE